MVVKALKHPFLEHRGLLGVAGRVELHGLLHAKLGCLDLEEFVLEFGYLAHHQLLGLAALDHIGNELSVLCLDLIQALREDAHVGLQFVQVLLGHYDLLRDHNLLLLLLLYLLLMAR